MPNSLFTAPIETISLDDIHSFLDSDLEEGTRLDYKEAEKNKDGPPASMIDVIVAFANTQGGLLILGVEADKLTNRPIKREGLILLKRANLEEVITSRCYSSIIPPLVPEIGVCPFKSDTALSAPDRAFVVIRVQASTTVHSTKDNRVLYRVNSECQNADLMTLRFLLEREQKREEIIQRLSYEILDGYWFARQKLLPTISDDSEKQRWKPFTPRIYMECIPLDAPADLLPFGLHFPGKNSLDDQFLDGIGAANWNLYHHEMLPQGLALYVDIDEVRLGYSYQRNTVNPLSLIYFDKTGGMLANLAIASLGNENTSFETRIQKLCSLEAKLFTLLQAQLREYGYTGRVEIQTWTATENWESEKMLATGSRDYLNDSKKHGHFGSAVLSVLDSWPEQSQKIGLMISQLTRSMYGYSFAIRDWGQGRRPNLLFADD